jgi:S1-C subfamily serine protease
MLTKSLEHRLDPSVRFPTGHPHFCGNAASFLSPRFAGRLAFFSATAILLFTIGCAQLPPSTAQLQPAPIARQDLIDQIVTSSVKVAVERDARVVAYASGIVIASRPATGSTEAVSYVLTAAHTFAGGGETSIFVGFCGSAAARGKFSATVISQGTGDTLDLALLRVRGVAAPPVLFPTDDRVRLGQPILVVGFPEGQRLGISGGIVSQLPLSEIENGIPADREEHRIMIDAAAPRGVSGGGVFEVETGRLVGIVQGHQTVSVAVKDQAQSYALKFPVPGATFVVPAEQIRPFLARPEVATEMSTALPVIAHATPVLSR